ncbi:MAG: glycosyltransferase family 2 protein [Bacteroidales bacterium]|nr:glycosyltransferase family 2 protein [Bacteroidales bacterium]
MDISVLVPLYNEDESLKELNDWILRVLKSNHFTFEIVYVDDGSTDRSWELVESFAKTEPNIKGIRFLRNYGKSAALHEGFKMVSGEVVITMDADMQDSPDEIPELYKMIREEGFDLVSGWKKKRYDPFIKRTTSKFYNGSTRMLSGIKLHDFNCGLKAYRHDVVKSIEVYGEMHRYIPVIAKHAGFNKIGEKVVQHRKRKYGVTKFGADRFVKGYLDLLTITFTSRFMQRPMHFFGALGSVLFLIGFGIAGYLTYAKIFMEAYHMTDRPLFYFGLLAMILGTQLFVAGFLGEMISRGAENANKHQIKRYINFKIEK